MKKTDEQRFREKVKIDKSGCWLWTGYKDHKGYGRYYSRRRKREIPAHRFTYERLNGPIPPGYDTHHKCGVKHCVNPRHIEIILHKEHMRIHAKSGVWAGEKNSQSLYTDLNVMTVKILRRVFMIPARWLSEKMNIRLSTIYYFSSKQGWRHLEPEFEKIIRENL